MPGFYLKGAFVQFMPTFLVPLPNVIMFQYNPETMTHTWKPSAPEVSPDSKTKPNPLAVKGLPGESFSFTLMMDSSDTIADGSAVTAGLAKATGLYSRLAALEMLLYPSGLVHFRINCWGQSPPRSAQHLRDRQRKQSRMCRNT